ncbi:MAG: DUF2314 domain-containing protein [Planctomycetes bacterium]|nr:DUF2314 domain-containing protein [Planctomycetota bacterium]
MGKKAGWLFLVLAIGVVSFLARNHNEKSDHDVDAVIDISDDDAKMNKAIEEARNSLPEFIERFKAPQPGDENFSLKVRFEDENGTEHFWCSMMGVKDEKFDVIIANEPQTVKNVTNGMRTMVTKDMISDWAYMQNKVMQGNRTLRVLFEHMPEDEVNDLKKMLGWE